MEQYSGRKLLDNLEFGVSRGRNIFEYQIKCYEKGEYIPNWKGATKEVKEDFVFCVAPRFGEFPEDMSQGDWRTGVDELFKYLQEIKYPWYAAGSPEDVQKLNKYFQRKYDSLFFEKYAIRLYFNTLHKESDMVALMPAMERYEDHIDQFMNEVDIDLKLKQLRRDNKMSFKTYLEISKSSEAKEILAGHVIENLRFVNWYSVGLNMVLADINDEYDQGMPLAKLVEIPRDLWEIALEKTLEEIQLGDVQIDTAPELEL